MNEPDTQAAPGKAKAGCRVRPRPCQPVCKLRQGQKKSQRQAAPEQSMDLEFLVLILITPEILDPSLYNKRTPSLLGAML